MGPVETLLREAWEIIKEPEKRCSEYCAVDSEGKEVETDSPEACRWCSLGAVGKAAGKGPYDNLSKAEGYLTMAVEDLSGHDMVSVYNDYDHIKNPPRLYQKAIELAAKDEA